MPDAARPARGLLLLVVDAESGMLVRSLGAVCTEPRLCAVWKIERVPDPESAFHRLGDAFGPQSRVDAIAIDPWAWPDGPDRRTVNRLCHRFPGVRIIVGSERLREGPKGSALAADLAGFPVESDRVIHIELPCAPVELAQVLEWSGRIPAGNVANQKRSNGSVNPDRAVLQWTSAVDDAGGPSSRWTLERSLHSLWRDAKDSGSAHTVCVIAIDRCKLVLDPAGAAVRESVLRQVRQRILTRLPPSSCVGSLPDGAIGICLVKTSMEEARHRVAAGLNDIRSQPFRAATFTLQLTASAGLASIDPGYATGLDSLRSASIALDVAAGAGGDRITGFREDDQECSTRRRLEESLPDIESALADERFRLYAQLIVPTQLAGPVHAEVLVRMVGRDGAIKPPATFIATAERYGIIGRIDRWVLRRALSLLSGWKSLDVPFGHLAVNLSGLTLSDPDALAWIEQQVIEAQLPDGRLCIEITETAALGQSTSVSAFIARLQGLGVRFSLDDFGAGFSSFTYLESVPTDILKIDGSLVRDVSGVERREQLLRTINDVGHLFGKHTVAEFVEDAAAMALVTRLGIDYAQGYFIGRPLPAEQLPQEIDRWLKVTRSITRLKTSNAPETQAAVR